MTDLPLPEPDLCDGCLLSEKGRYLGTCDGYTEDALRAYALAAVEAERERCAKVCDDAVQRYYSGGFAEASGACLQLGEQIRAR